MSHPDPALKQRTLLVLAFLIGGGLLAFGLLRSPSSGTGAAVPDSRREELGKVADESLEMAIPGPSQGGEAAAQGSRSEGAMFPASDESALGGSETVLLVTATHLRGRTPAAEARISLWRQATGQGPSYRPARRLTELRTGADGRVRFQVPAEVPLEIVGQAKGKGPGARRELDPLPSGETRSIELLLERPPKPITVYVSDAESGEPISGAALRIVAVEGLVRGTEEFPGTHKLVSRTDGMGVATLPGSSRDQRWLLVDAAGYSPLAIRPKSLGEQVEFAANLERAASLRVTVTDAAGTAASGMTVCLVVNLSGYRTQFTKPTDHWGQAQFKRLPVGVPCVVTAGEPEGDPMLYDPVTLRPGEKRTVAVQLP